MSLVEHLGEDTVKQLVDKKIVKGDKFDQGKLRYDLLPTYALRQIARVFTFGCEKYGDRNWENGIEWSKLMGSFERHYQAFKACEDMDPESGLYHMAHAVTNGLMILENYRIHPELDNRYKPYMHERKIVLDVDDVIADFAGGYKKRFGASPHNYWDFTYSMGDNLKALVESEEGESFFVNLEVKHRPNFIPHAYVSSRSVPVEWTKKFIEKNGLPCRPVYHVPWNESKVEVLKEIGAEFFIDDKFQNFREAESAGIPSFLMDAEHNQHHNVGYRRLSNLDIKNIVR